MNVVQFKRPESRNAPPPPKTTRRSFAEFAMAMGVTGLIFFLLPTLWSGFSNQLLGVVHLLVAVVYFQQGPRIAAGVWIALSLALLFVADAPSPVTYALARGAFAIDALMVR